jgi:hypothetical protein
MNHKVLKKYSFKWQADQLAAMLYSAQIESKILENPREYAAIVTGISNDKFSVVIHHKDFIKASEIEKELSSVNEDSEVETPIAIPHQNTKQIILRSLLVFIILIVVIALSI